MSRTWLLRGVVVGVFVVLVGAWGVGLAGVGGTQSSTGKPPAPAPSDTSDVSDGRHATVLDRAQPRRAREAGRSRDARAEATADPTAEPVVDVPATQAPPSTDHPSASPEPSEEPDRSPPPAALTNPPSQPSPSSPPSQPADGCTDLVGIVDCVLDPITGAP